MSNIHQNDELLRVQDENYSIVFNYDKHENGGVAVHAEKDGKNHKVNPEYARAALVKKIGSSGGGWPSDLPKPSVGGYGYTEQGEQTVITWDGDTEGHYTINIEGELNLVHVSDKTPASIIGGSIITSKGDTLDIRDDSVMMSGEWGYIPNQALVVCIFNDNTAVEDLGVTFDKKGIYFAGGEFYVMSLTYDTPDTVHKIDEKYLPVAQEKTEVIVTNIGDAWEFDAETIPQNLDDYSNINFIVYYLAPTAVGHDYIYAVIPCATCTYQFDMISSISGLPFVNGSTMIVPRIVYSENTNRYYGRVSEYDLQDHIE